MRYFITVILYFLLCEVNAQIKKNPYLYSIKDLQKVSIHTGNIQKTTFYQSNANITVVSQKMIFERGYRTLVDVCQDIPGFDFLMFNDGGGEYPTQNKHRGLGEVGNPEILMMINGVVQNNISYNWSLLWTYDQMLLDVLQIEIIKGPGSVLYGAQAFSGVINIITNKSYDGVMARSSVGRYDTWENGFVFGTEFFKELKVKLSYQHYQTDGDMGLDSYDPGNYFSGNKYPKYLVADYDAQGNFLENTDNSNAGNYIPNGFNTVQNSSVLRADIQFKTTCLQLFFTDISRGQTSANVPYEYNSTDKAYLSRQRNFNVSLFDQRHFNSKIHLSSQFVYRNTNILPETGFKYMYRFPDFQKSYKSFSNQAFIEEKLTIYPNHQTTLLAGIKLTGNIKSDRIISLGSYDTDHHSTSSSWNIAANGFGLNQSEYFSPYYETEMAVYGVWEQNWADRLYSSFGLRYDYSTDFGGVFIPRFTIVYNPDIDFVIKLLYGKAFRQPGLFELNDEFRGNNKLVPEKIHTFELVLNQQFFDNKLNAQLNFYYSTVIDYIGKVPDSSMLAFERYENLPAFGIFGTDFSINYQINKNWEVYANMGLNKSYDPELKTIKEIDRIAAFKLNAGLTTRFINEKLIFNLRSNYVGKRKAPPTNLWMQQYEKAYAPSYFLLNLVTSYHINYRFSVQLKIDNLLNHRYYGLGRETGSGFIEDYNNLTNINPDGHIPAYHPQKGMSYLFSLIYRFKNG